jgi:predicted outer membrane protein
LRRVAILFGVALVAAALWHNAGGVLKPTVESGVSAGAVAGVANDGAQADGTSTEEWNFALPPPSRTGTGTAVPARLAAVVTQNLPRGWTMTPWGPLTPADRDVLVRVRQAGLWEMPAGTMAQTQSDNQRVKEVGATLRADHTILDQQTRDTAAKLGVTLPDQPNSDQQGWLGLLSGKVGHDFDTNYAQLLRAAHGKVFSVLAANRAATNNDLIRGFTQIGIDVVMKHMTLLESTTFVNYGQLPPAPNPSTAAAAPADLVPLDARSKIVWSLLLAGAGFSVIAVFVYRRRQRRVTN